MGLDIKIKGLEREDTYHGGYITFNLYRKNVASAYNERLGELYKKHSKMNCNQKKLSNGISYVMMI